MQHTAKVCMLLCIKSALVIWIIKEKKSALVSSTNDPLKKYLHYKYLTIFELHWIRGYESEEFIDITQRLTCCLFFVSTSVCYAIC
jgi:hypothetical protein